jgi:tight adherence protein C
VIPETGTLLVWLGGAAAAFIVMVLLLSMGREKHVANRLADVTADRSVGQVAAGSTAKLLSADSGFDWGTRRRLHHDERRRRLRERMMQAGFYATASGSMFMMFRLLLIAGAAGLGFLFTTLSKMTLPQGIGTGVACGVAATIAPGFWLDRIKRSRQTNLRRALPDALDVLVVCLQGGLSVMASLSRVANELAVAHPLLAVEIKIAERQMQMGQTAGEAIRGIADRFDMEELRGMSAVVKQAERIGASVATALEVFAENLRLKRHQRAEEMAHKAAVKMLIPTVLFIFPAIFVVILGPAAIQVYNNLIMGALK